jgi:hypothetical protein
MANKPAKPNPWAGASKLRSRGGKSKKSSGKGNAWAAYVSGGRKK